MYISVYDDTWKLLSYLSSAPILSQINTYPLTYTSTIKPNLTDQPSSDINWCQLVYTMINILKHIHIDMIVITAIDVKRYDYLYQCLEIVYEHIVLSHPSYNIASLLSSLTSSTSMRGHNSDLNSIGYIHNIISHNHDIISSTIPTDTMNKSSTNNNTTMIPILLIIHSIIMTHSKTINRLLSLLHTHEDALKRLSDNKNKRKGGGGKSSCGVATAGGDGGKILNIIQSTYTCCISYTICI